mgnify:CR=1 FL=1
MRIGIISGVIGLFVTLPVHAQKSDSIKSMLLPDVVVTESYQQRQAKKSALTVEVIEQDFLRKHFTGNFMQAVENIPGVQAMDIGSGFSKPMIRGMGFKPYWKTESSRKASNGEPTTDWNWMPSISKQSMS